MMYPNSLPEHMDYVLRNSGLLNPLEEKFGIKIGEFGKPEVIPGKQYGARVTLPATYNGESFELITIAFRPGDGTGDTSTYREGQLDINPEFQFIENPSRVYPRAKKLPDGSPLPIEGVIPLFVTRTGEGSVIAHNSTLLELGIVGQNAVGILGKMQTFGRPSILLTVGKKGNQRFGDPHAIVAPRESGMENSYQVAAFFAAKEVNSKVFELLNTRGQMLPNY